MIENSIIKKTGSQPGKTVAIFAGVHGNEKVGVKVLERLEKELRVTAGNVFLVYANPPAIEANKRALDKNLNRLFSEKQNDENTYEDQRAKELMEILDQCDAVLDIHSYNSPDGKQFSFCEPNGYEIIKLMDFPIIVSRHNPDPKMYSTTVMGYMNKKGGVGICLECGTSNKPDDFFDLALKSSYQFLYYFGNIDQIVPFDTVKQQVIKNDRMLYKKNDNFRFVKDFKDFEPLPVGQPFAFDGDEPLSANPDECIIFPRPNVPVGGEVCLIGLLK
ncbi:MAG: succinylglutamate desuccinylase/aspartoacylase family protein [Patescibacteria group bacterium]